MTPAFPKASRVDERVIRDREAEAHNRAVYKAVDARDKRECRACGRKSDPNAVGLLARGHRHHLQYRSAGGPTESWNLVTLCASCHSAEHVTRTLEIDGNADDALAFWKKDDAGEWFLWRREIAVGQFHKD
jgi:5-methylcytosine-specific restriction endonuclease McrA